MTALSPQFPPLYLGWEQSRYMYIYILYNKFQNKPEVVVYHPSHVLFIVPYVCRLYTHPYELEIQPAVAQGLRATAMGFGFSTENGKGVAQRGALCSKVALDTLW